MVTREKRKREEPQPDEQRAGKQPGGGRGEQGRLRTGRCRTRPSDTARPRARALGRRGATAGAREAGRKLRARRRLWSRARLCGKKAEEAAGPPQEARGNEMETPGSGEEKQRATNSNSSAKDPRGREEPPRVTFRAARPQGRRCEETERATRVTVCSGRSGARASRGRWPGSIGDGSGSSRQDRQERECARPAWRRPPA